MTYNLTASDSDRLAGYTLFRKKWENLCLFVLQWLLFVSKWWKPCKFENWKSKKITHHNYVYKTAITELKTLKVPYTWTIKSPFLTIFCPHRQINVPTWQKSVLSWQKIVPPWQISCPFYVRLTSESLYPCCWAALLVFLWMGRQARQASFSNSHQTSQICRQFIWQTNCP